ncbi:hypothetical protein MNBD_GAMMA09-176 [hydrothermal vent metagenome]|uniref:Uncharacterized protein n=1 Tax=hydrothermal vent metagenome TaxID=652676 RepID=A0A3B0XEG3_9ZZZZ
MNHFVKTNSVILVGDDEIVIELMQNDISLFALELIMLLMGLIKKTVIVFSCGTRLFLCLETDLSDGDKAVVNKKENHISIGLAKNHLEYFCSFLLKTYRDQAAEVNHIHIEGKKGELDYDLTFLFEKYAPSMTSDEASKLMGD